MTCDDIKIENTRRKYLQAPIHVLKKELDGCTGINFCINDDVVFGGRTTEYTDAPELSGRYLSDGWHC